MRRDILLLALPIFLGAGLAGAGSDPPPSTHVDEMVKDALALDEREQAEAWLAASERYEDRDNLDVFQANIDQGRYDKAALFRLGDEMFSHEFTLDDGYGDRGYVAPRRVHAGVRGGTDTFSCAGCHSVGGPDGAGGPTQNAMVDGDGDRMTSANMRNPPALLGLGLVQAIAAEMSADLENRKRRALLDARLGGAEVTATLETHGVSFGRVTARPDGTATVYAEGIASDLVVRPFGWKGTVARLRRFVEDAARIHFGIQSTVLAEQHHQRPDPGHLGAGADWFDPDGDGKAHELEEGVLTAAACYLAMLEVPVIVPPRDPGLRERWASGSRLFDTIGCARCHARVMPLHDRIWHERADTTGGEVVLDVLADGDLPKGPPEVHLFSDLKRHEMGPVLADGHAGEDRLPRGVFLTRPLWGLADSAPYLHDGRAPTIPDAILAHGGEAQAARDAFAALTPGEQASVHVFLLSLTREPKVRFAR